jgi:hypothetical protein
MKSTQRRKRRLQSAAICLPLMLVHAAATGAETGAIFSCGSASSGARFFADPKTGGLCKALEKELRKRFSTLKIESRDGDQASVNSFRIEFVPEKVSRHGVSGRLRWRADLKAHWMTGPVIQTVVIDKALNDEVLSEFAKNLVAISRF